MKTIQTHRLRTALLSLFVVLGIIACNIPVKYTETVGNILSWTVSDPGGTVEDQVNTFPWIFRSDLTVESVLANGMPVKTFRTILDPKTDSELNAIISDITALEGYLNYQLTPIDEQTTVPVYRAVLHTFINIDIDASDMNDEELIAAIRDQLIQQGTNPTHITVSHPTPETLEFGFEFEGPSEPGMQREIQIEICLEEGGDNDTADHVQANMLQLSPEEVEGKTSEEIRDLIIQKYRESGLEIPENLNVNYENGQLEINIQDEE